VVVVPEECALFEGKPFQRLAGLHDLVLRLLCRTTCQYLVHLRTINMIADSLELKVNRAMENRYHQCYKQAEIYSGIFARQAGLPRPAPGRGNRSQPGIAGLPGLRPTLRSPEEGTRPRPGSGRRPNRYCQDMLKISILLFIASGLCASIFVYNRGEHRMSLARHSSLSRRKRQIMGIVYRKGRAAVREIRAELPSPPSYSAFRATASILEHKGYLSHSRDGRRHLYAQRTFRRRVMQKALRHLLGTYFDDSLERAVTVMLELHCKNLSDG
jgi:predicted transcriptional regulator